VTWERAIDSPILSTKDSADQKWEATQIYAPYLLRHHGVDGNKGLTNSSDGDSNGGICDIFYNANSGSSEQSGIAHLEGGCAAFP
jgi:hypothetical protein